jgi:hypothetical protein
MEWRGLSDLKRSEEYRLVLRVIELLEEGFNSCTITQFSRCGKEALQKAHELKGMIAVRDDFRKNNK